MCVGSVITHVQLFCDPLDCGPPGSSVHGIFQARVLEWVAIAFSAFVILGKIKRNTIKHVEAIVEALTT